MSNTHRTLYTAHLSQIHHLFQKTTAMYGENVLRRGKIAHDTCSCPSASPYKTLENKGTAKRTRSDMPLPDTAEKDACVPHCARSTSWNAHYSENQGAKHGTNAIMGE